MTDQMIAAVRSAVEKYCGYTPGAHCVAEIVAAVLANSSAPAAEDKLPTDLSKRLRDIARGERPLTASAMPEVLVQAADEIERYYGGMLAWKQTAEKKDADWNAERMGRVDDRISARTTAVGAGDLEQQIITQRIAITPEYGGGFHAAIYGEEAEPAAKGFGRTPSEAIQAVKPTAAPQGEVKS